MPVAAPPLSSSAFASELRRWSLEPLLPVAIDAIYAHYQELLRWNRTLALIGPAASPQEIVARHYGESLAALPLIPREAEQGLDIGSGAGFPGQILCAARFGLRFTLAEARERKWSFLK